jgi:hypothetical protein
MQYFHVLTWQKSQLSTSKQHIPVQVHTARKMPRQRHHSKSVGKTIFAIIQGSTKHVQSIFLEIFSYYTENISI